MMPTPSLDRDQSLLEHLLARCRAEPDPHRLADHLQALFTFLLTRVARQSSLCQRSGEPRPELDEALETRLIHGAAGCIGTASPLLAQLHDLLHRDDRTTDPAADRAAADRLLNRVETGLRRFQDWLARVTPH
nr:probable nitrogenase component 1, alpha and beta subunits [uncultured bacterium]